MQRIHHSEPRRQRAVVAVQVAVSMTMMLGFCALAIDVGAMYNTRGELQRTADAAALAAASRLADYDLGDPLELARQDAALYAQRNVVLGEGIVLDPYTDVEFGRAYWNDYTGSYDFVPTEVSPDAVRVRVRKTADSANGAMPLYFAPVLGKSTVDMSAEAIAMMVPRDIAVVADLSGSHTDDSELLNYDETDINLAEVWDALPGGADGGGSLWGGEFPPDQNGTPNPQSLGPGWGSFKQLGWGTLTIDAAYDPTLDPGLIELEYNQDWTGDSIARQLLIDQGYSDSPPEDNEVDALLESTYDGDGAWKYRVAVMLGVARWDSGKPGGLWESIPDSDPGNGNDWIGGCETTWIENYPYASGTWTDYIENYVRGTWTQMYHANNDFRYRFGLKTLVNYLLERKPYHYATPELAQTPTQPMQAVKESVQHMMEVIVALETDDQASLEIYGTTARHEVDLTQDYFAVSNRLNEMQGAHYDSWTNMGGGIEKGIQELSSARARGNSIKVIILLTDGCANVTESGNAGYQYEAEARQYATDQAQEAADAGMRIYTVSVGSGADQPIMQQIAEIGHGEHFHAEGSIEEYSAQLDTIFAKLGGTRPVELIR